MGKRQRKEDVDDAADTTSACVYEGHQALMRVYANSNRSSVSQHDMDVIRAHFQFLRDDDADAERGNADWQVRMSVRYYRKLFREYALADLSRYQEGKIGLRWRTEGEVVSGKGQFVCGNKQCDARADLRSYELLFAYVEQGEKKRCLVKVRACEQCAAKIFYRKLQQVKVKKEDKSAKKTRTKKRWRRSDSDASSESDGSSSDKDDHDESRSHDTRRGGGESNIHALCAAINASERVQTQEAMIDATSSGGFFEDRKGDKDAFRDLLL